MTSYLLAGPAVEPLSLADAKAFLKVDDTAEDGLIASLVTAARIHVETTTGRALVAQTWRLVRDGLFAGETVTLPIAPLLELLAVTAYDATGAETALDPGGFQTGPERVTAPDTLPGLPVLRRRQAIQIDYIAGYGEAAPDVPADLRQAMLMLIAFWFENRDGALPASGEGVAPPGFAQLLRPYRSARL